MVGGVAWGAALTWTKDMAMSITQVHPAKQDGLERWTMRCGLCMAMHGTRTKFIIIIRSIIIMNFGEEDGKCYDGLIKTVGWIGQLHILVAQTPIISFIKLVNWAKPNLHKFDGAEGLGQASWRSQRSLDKA